uniref:Translocon-associated protein subunit gamma n=1 Tax=Acrobeloides nanus TaxID=290746 RepID=A0A914CVE4_9BILA
MSKTKFTKEDELLLKDFSSHVSKKGHAIFYVSAAVVSLAPLYLFYGVHQMEIADSWIIWILAAAISTYLLQFSYKNLHKILKHQVVVKRGDAIARELNREFAGDKKMTTKEKDERILWKKNEVGDYEATTFTIFYNNVLFYAILMVLSFFILANINPAFNCLISMAGASDLEI